MKKILFLSVSSFTVLAFVLISLLPPVAYSDSKEGVTDTTIKIGIYGPFTGPVAAWGTAFYGATIVYNDTNEKGGIHGRKIITVLEDDACSPEKAKGAVKKLIYDEKVFLIHGGNCSLAIMATKDTIIETGIPYVVGGAALDAIASPLVKNIFNPCIIASIEGETNINFIASKPGVKNIAIVRHPDEWAMSRYLPMLKKAKEMNLKVVADEVMDRKVTDATTQVLKIKQTNPDAIMMVLYPAEGAVFIRNAHKFGIDVPIVGTSAGDINELNTKVGLPEAMKNFYFLTGYRSIHTPEMEKWAKLIQKYYPNLPKDQYSLTCYGAQGALVVVKALRDAGRDLSRDKFIAAMDNIRNFETGIYWAPVSFSPTDHQGLKEGSFVTLVGGKEFYIGNKWKEIRK